MWDLLFLFESLQIKKIIHFMSEKVYSEFHLFLCVFVSTLIFLNWGTTQWIHWSSVSSPRSIQFFRFNYALGAQFKLQVGSDSIIYHHGEFFITLLQILDCLEPHLCSQFFSSFIYVKSANKFSDWAQLLRVNIKPNFNFFIFFCYCFPIWTHWFKGAKLRIIIQPPPPTISIWL